MGEVGLLKLIEFRVFWRGILGDDRFPSGERRIDFSARKGLANVNLFSAAHDLQHRHSFLALFIGTNIYQDCPCLAVLGDDDRLSFP